MFSYTNPPGASVAWPPRDERQGWHLPPTRGGRCDGGVNDAAAAPRATRLGKDEGDEDHRDRDGETAAPARDPAGACLLGRRRCRSRDARHGRDVTRDPEGRRVGRVKGGDWNLTDGGETTIVINDVRRPRRGHGAHRVALTSCGLPCRATRTNRDFLLAITGIIASKNARSFSTEREAARC